MTTPAFVHIQRSGVSVTLPASASEWAAWDARFAAARDVTPMREPMPATDKRGR